MNKHLTRTSKFLSLVLRHKPETIGVTLDEEGWIRVDELLEACQRNGRTITVEELATVVETNDKKRFVMREGRIRANQGHSIEVNLRLESCEPPALLYHGTSLRFMDSIRDKGLLKMNRQHVHLSADTDTALNVGARHGKPIVLLVHAARMHVAGHEFFLSENGVWLTRHVPQSYLEESSVKR